VLTGAQRASRDRILTCVSRARTPELVIDL